RDGAQIVSASVGLLMIVCSSSWSGAQRCEEAADIRRPRIAHLIAVVGHHPHVWEEDMAAGVVAGQSFVRLDHKRITLKADDVLIGPASADLLRLQLMFFSLAAAVHLDPAQHGVTIAVLVVRARALDS